MPNLGVRKVILGKRESMDWHFDLGNAKTTSQNNLSEELLERFMAATGPHKTF